MHIHLTQGSGVPLYLQIVNQVKYLVAAGRLSPGDEVPAIRALAQQLIINPNTVARAYRELEVAGVLSKRQGAGTYISSNGTPLARRERMRIMRERADAFLAEARQLDIDLHEVIGLIQERSEALDRQHEEGDGE
ncbi:MAG: GntR family transcriptional regulator [bacterium]|nr:GntR family transcriptional regulator [bacterium]